MEAMSGLDLFGSNGSFLSTIQVQADEVAQCNAILQSLLPRESHSKVGSSVATATASSGKYSSANL